MTAPTFAEQRIRPFYAAFFRLGAVLRVGRAFGFRNVSVDMDTFPNADGGCADP